MLDLRNFTHCTDSPFETLHSLWNKATIPLAGLHSNGFLKFVYICLQVRGASVSWLENVSTALKDLYSGQKTFLSFQVEKKGNRVIVYCLCQRVIHRGSSV